MQERKSESGKRSEQMAAASATTRAVTTKKVIVQFPVPLLERTEALANALNTDRSKLIRTAVEEKIERLERERLEVELRDGYLANADLMMKTYTAFEGIVTEALNQDDEEA